MWTFRRQVEAAGGTCFVCGVCSTLKGFRAECNGPALRAEIAPVGYKSKKCNFLSVNLYNIFVGSSHRWVKS